MNTPTTAAPHPIPAREIPARAIRTRRIAFEYPTLQMPHYFVDGDPVMSHIVSFLSGVFPEGEDFFVRSVRNYRDQIVDPELKTQVAGFIGQEAMHSREHERFNEQLHEIGYPTRLIDTTVGVLLRFGSKVLPKKLQLAITAALEHYTATLAEVLLTSPEGRDMFDVDEVRSLFLWHALEESEHKSVAFDVYQEVSGNHFLRVAVIQAVTLGFVGGGALVVIGSLAFDPASWKNPRHIRRSIGALRNSPWLSKTVRTKISDYNRRDFHPDDHDNAELTEQWRTTLFAADSGTLTPRLQRGAAVSQAQ